MSQRYKPLGLRREVLLFLPLAVLLLIIIASFNLLVYRNAIGEIESERLEEAEALASRAASLLAGGVLPDAEQLERLAPHASAVAVFDSSGRIVAQSGAPVPLDPSGLRPEPMPEGVRAFTPLDLDAPTIAVVAPFERGGRSYRVQIDLPAQRLATHRFSLRRIVTVNVVALGTLTVLVLLFARRLLQPYESLMESARRVDPGATPGEENRDEVEFLVETFEQALAALDRPHSQRAADEIAVLERTLAPSLESGFMLLDDHGRVLAVNQLGAELLQIDRPTEPVDLDELLAHESDLRAVLQDAIEHRTAIQRHECELGAAGGHRIIGLTAHPLRRDDNALHGFIVLYADLTAAQAQQRRAQLDHSLAQLGELAAGVAHELRNGLATLKGYVGLMEHAPGRATVEEFLPEMRRESEHLERVLNDFLSFARPGSARLEMLSLAAVVARAAADPALSDVSIEIEQTSELPPVEADAQLLERALRNLLYNAAEAHRRAEVDKPVLITIQAQDDRLLLQIVDSGHGLAREVRERLFQPFASAQPDGVGLGLALAHRITRLHGGDLKVEDHTGGGTVASLDLPVKNVT